MSIRVAVFCVAACLAASGAAAQKAPANDDCLACHGDASLKRDDGRSLAVESETLKASTHGAMACVDCHADLSKLADFPHESKLARVQCASCHDEIGGKYHDSIHAWAKEKAGLVGAPTCASCHGSHDVKAHTDKASRVYRANVPATCGACHAGVLEQYEKGVHAAALKKGDAHAPACIACHNAHAIARTDTDTWRLGLTAECGSCHAKVAGAFRLTFHGKVNAMGSTRVAACASCHGAHQILPASNPASMIAPAQLKTTCGRCHQGANDNFVRYDPHPDPTNYQRSAALWWANRFYWLLIPGCFAFFGLHSLLWFRRSRQDVPPLPPLAGPSHLRRFDASTRRLHIVVMASFLGLSATGLPLLFSEAPWSRVLAAVFGGFRGAGLVHRFFGATLLAAVAWHVGQISWRAFVRGERGLFWGPSSMVPQPRDVVQLFQQLRWFAGGSARPRWDHFTYWEKFDYWAVLWGTGLMGAAGLVLWFPAAASHVLPGWMFNFALFVHGAEATLAIGFIFVIHFFNGHLRPGKFPMDLVIFTGVVTDHELHEERPAEYARLADAGELAALAVPPPSPDLRKKGYIIGTTGLTLGVVLVLLILYAALR